MSKETDLFISKNANDVIQSVKGTGIFASLKMAQMIIESSGKDENGKFGIGKGLAVRKANNHFGIKANKGWKGKSIALSTPRDGKPVSLFRIYPTVLDSLKDHTQFLLSNSRYRTNGVFISKTPQEQAQALQRAGYSESPTYGKTLIALIKAYHLEQLDGKKSILVSNTSISKSKSNTTAMVVLGVSALVIIGGAYYFREDLKTNYQKLVA